jgi:hypothetical protein
MDEPLHGSPAIPPETLYNHLKQYCFCEWAFGYSSNEKIFPNYSSDPTRFSMSINSPSANWEPRSQLVAWSGYSIAHVLLEINP